MLFQTNETTAWFFASGTGLAIVGSATMFKWKGILTEKIHYLGSFIAIASALIGLGVEYNNWIPTAVFIAIGVTLNAFKIKNRIWWTEITAFMCIILGLLFRFV
jgi:hypothetical protein